MARAGKIVWRTGIAMAKWRHQQRRREGNIENSENNESGEMAK
jgi:hypothetical protein